MNRRQVLIFTAAAIVVATSASPTGGFSAGSADRDISAVIALDDRAFLGVETIDQTVEAGPPKDVVLLELENRLGQRLTDIDVVVENDESTPPVLQQTDAPSRLGVGERATVLTTVNCDDGNGNSDIETWLISVSASGDDVMIELTRSVTVTCERTIPATVQNQTAATSTTTTPG